MIGSFHNTQDFDWQRLIQLSSNVLHAIVCSMKILLSSVSTAISIRRTYSHRNRSVPINAKHACVLGHYLETF